MEKTAPLLGELSRGVCIQRRLRAALPIHALGSFTGFRVYRRRALEGLVLTEAAALESGSDVAKLLLGSGIEIAEIPIHYRTFKGFTNVKTRLRRGLKNAVGILT